MRHLSADELIISIYEWLQNHNRAVKITINPAVVFTAMNSAARKSTGYLVYKEACVLETANNNWLLCVGVVSRDYYYQGNVSNKAVTSESIKTLCMPLETERRVVDLSLLPISIKNKSEFEISEMADSLLATNSNDEFASFSYSLLRCNEDGELLITIDCLLKDNRFSQINEEISPFLYRLFGNNDELYSESLSPILASAIYNHIITAPQQ